MTTATTANDALTSFDISDLPTVFGDMEPVPQADGPTAVCRIDYPPNFKTAFDYFRALLQRTEYSPRALRLTELCLEQNPANYTVWHYRRACLDTITQGNAAAWDFALQADLDLAARLGGDNPKNYQIWYHRRAILEKYAQQQSAKEASDDMAQQELDYVHGVLQVDGKNYHAWSHRQWLLQTLANDETVWKKELEYTQQLIQQDVRNNSAWNQRWFVTHHDRGNAVSVEAAVAELEFALQQAARDLFNESTFSYFTAVAKELKRNHALEFGTTILPTFGEQLNALAPSDDDDDDDVSPHLLATRVEWLAWQGNAAGAGALLDRLGESVDPIRRKYWNLRKTQLVVE